MRHSIMISAATPRTRLAPARPHPAPARDGRRGGRRGGQGHCGGGTTRSLRLRCPGAGLGCDIAMLGRWLAGRLRQPPVLGELVIGVLVGNIGYWLGLPLFAVVMHLGGSAPRLPGGLALRRRRLCGRRTGAGAREPRTPAAWAAELLPLTIGPHGLPLVYAASPFRSSRCSECSSWLHGGASIQRRRAAQGRHPGEPGGGRRCRRSFRCSASRSECGCCRRKAGPPTCSWRPPCVPPASASPPAFSRIWERCRPPRPE